MGHHHDKHHHDKHHDHHDCCDEHNMKEGMFDEVPGEMAQWMLTSADEAWTELFKEKVKKHYETMMGEKID